MRGKGAFLCGCDGGVDCRVWDYPGELHAEAPTGLIVEALLSEIGRPGGARGEETPGATPPGDVPDNLKLFFAGTGAASAAASCCSTGEQATCCDPAEKAGCCDDAAESSCGCR